MKVQFFPDNEVLASAFNKSRITLLYKSEFIGRIKLIKIQTNTEVLDEDFTNITKHATKLN